VSSLTLVDADTAQPIPQFNPLVSGATINLAVLPSHNLTIQANTVPATVGSVVFDLVDSGYLNTVNTAPYDLCGSAPCPNLDVGLHSLTTTPYFGSGGSGGAGKAMSISFSVIDPTPTPAPTPSPTPTPTPKATTLTSTLVLTSANNGQTFNNYRISTTSGPCVVINNATNITIENFNIGPCGQNNSNNDSNGIEIHGGSGINIYDSYIHIDNLGGEAYGNLSTTRSHENIIGVGSGGGGGPTDITIQGNVVGNGSSNIFSTDHSNGWVINGNYIFNAQGHDGASEQIQPVNSWNMAIENNYLYSCQKTVTTQYDPICPASPAYLYGDVTQDNVNFWNNAPQGHPAGTVSGNYIIGGGWNDGTGITADQYADGLTVTNNTVLEVGNAPLGHYSGNDWTATGNIAWANFAIYSTQVAAYDNNGYSVSDFGPCLWQNNIMTTHGGAKDNNYYWAGKSPTCSSMTGYGFNGNTVGAAADSALGLNSSMTAAQVMAHIPPPLIPPTPKNCVVKSPYTTQTSKPSCP
jgi:hypothetical protein